MKLKTLDGVAHDIGQHAASGLSYLHPHVGNFCREHGLRQLTIDLTGEKQLNDVGMPTPLRLASQALHTTFRSILQKYDLPESSVTAARITFEFSGEDPWSFTWSSEITSVTGRTFRHTPAG